MDLSGNFSSVRDSITQSLVSITKSATRIAAEDVDFHRSSDPAIGSALDEQNGRLLALAEKLLGCSTNAVPPSLSEVDDIEVNWRSIVDVVDSLLEKVDTCLDEFTGLVKRMTPTDGAQSPIPRPRAKRLPLSLRNQDIPKPQLLFEAPAANREREPFRPFLTTKPHGKVPLEQSRKPVANDRGLRQFQHPYQVEIDEYQYPSSVYTRVEPIPYKPFETTSATFVDTFEGVLEMLQELRGASEIAVDLEHHDTHSYIGLVSLMQISTRDQDWIVDTLKPWRRRLEVLNEVFTDPRIVKVLHGAHMDIVWLQRDLGLYIVGLFDTHHASRVLGYAGGSLAFLLKKFIDFDAQKQYQIADWRTRPLPLEMFEYARSDTHFLLYVYDNMRNELVERSNFDLPEQDRVQAVLEKSKETALQRYEHSVYDELEGQGSTGWFQLLQRDPARLSEEQLAVFKKVHQWRDTLARELDESLNFVMPNYVISRVAAAMPSDATALLGVLHPISPDVRERAQDLLDIIIAARATFLSTPAPEAHYASTEQQQQRQTLQTRPGFRSRTSSFWGATILAKSSSDGVGSTPVLDAYSFSMPTGPYQLQEFTLQTTADPCSLLDFDQANESLFDVSGDADVSVQGSEGSRKRKRGEVPQSDIPTSPAVANPTAGVDDTPQDQEEDAMRRVRRKADKKAAKQKRKAERGELMPDVPLMEHVDYESAPPVLNAKKESRSGGKSAFNPYSKAQDGPAGLRRAQNSKVGKSATFKQI